MNPAADTLRDHDDAVASGTVRVRFAPSPTGELHLGSALTALANRAFAGVGEGARGTLVLRVDDTDRERSTPELVRHLVDALAWLGVAHDDGPYFQATRDDTHAAHLERLIELRRAYPCFCDEQRLDDIREQQIAAGQPPRYDGTCRHLSDEEVASRINRRERPAWRLRVPADRSFDVTDEIHGVVAAPPGSFSDFIIRRADGTFMYMFASVCDDIDLGITHVIRGEDHLPNTPRQIAIFDALDVAPPRWAHLPLIRGGDGRKLSKRDPLGTLDMLRERGVLAVTVRRYLAELLGAGAIDVLAAGATPLDLTRVPRSAPQVDADRLASIGREDIAALGRDGALALLAERGTTFTDAELPLVLAAIDGAGELGEIDAQLALVRHAPAADDVRPQDATDAKVVAVAVDHIAGDVNLGAADAAAEFVTWLRGLAKDESFGSPGMRGVMMPIRRALTGTTHGLPLPVIVQALGTDEVRTRLERAARAPV